MLVKNNYCQKKMLVNKNVGQKNCFKTKIFLNKIKKKTADKDPPKNILSFRGPNNI